MKSQPPLPERPRAHQLDEAATLALKMAFQPHLVEDCNQHDYGKDLRVKLIDENTSPQSVTGKEFSIQAKGTDVRPDKTVVVQVKSLRYWLNSHEPVMVAKVVGPGTASQKIWAVWIDAELKMHLTKNSPEWPQQETVTLPLPLEIKTGQLADIVRFVNDWRSVQDVAWDPGEFAAVEREAQDLATELLTLSTGQGLAGPAATLKQAAKQLKTLSYTVALLGNSRVGKSTLLNRLLGLELSPVDDLPTTAVVMSVSAGEQQGAIVHFLDGTSIPGEATSDFVRPYMTQQWNKDNLKNVAHVEVRLPDMLLSGGVRFLDLPGFHDSDPQIRAVSESALERVNACVYLIDIAPFKMRSFFISKDHIADLKALLDRCDRVLLVLSKADMLKKADRDKAAAYVHEQLEKFSLLDQLASPPILLGVPAKASSVDTAKKKSGWRSADQLKDEIWRVLLENGEVASARAHESFSSIVTAHADLTRACQAALLEGDRAGALLDRLATVEAEISEIGQRVDAKCQGIAQVSAQRISAAVQVVIGECEIWIRGIPTNQELPTNKDISARLYAAAQRVLYAEYQMVGAQASEVMRDAEHRVKTVLEQLPIGKLEQQPRVSMPPLPDIAPFPPSALQKVIVGGLAIGGFALWACVNPLTALLTIGTFLLGSFLDAEKARAEDVEKRVSTIRGLGPQVSSRAVNEIQRALVAFRDEVIRKTEDRGKYAIFDLRKSVSHAGKALTRSEKAEISALLAKLGTLTGRLNKLHARVMRATALPVSAPQVP